MRRTPSETPLWGEVDYECRVLDGDARAGGVVYDGRMVSALLARVVGSSNLEVANVVLTDRLLTTYSEEDLRHHLRTVVLGFPSVVSIPGIVEAPAKPRGYYVERQALEMAGASQAELESLKERYKGRFVDYGDPAVAEVLKRLVLQAVIFHLTLRPFCDKKNCRLFNAHWQEDLIASQLAPNGLCQIHKSEVRELGAMPRLQW